MYNAFCDSLNENDLYRLIDLIPWSPVCRTLEEEFGGMLLLGEILKGFRSFGHY